MWQVNGAEGGKTGYTNAARQTYVGKFKRAQGELVVALMGSETMWDDVKNLVEYGFKQMELRHKALPAVALAEEIPSRFAVIRSLLPRTLQPSASGIVVADRINSSL